MPSRGEEGIKKYKCLRYLPMWCMCGANNKIYAREHFAGDSRFKWFSFLCFQWVYYAPVRIKSYLDCKLFVASCCFDETVPGSISSNDIVYEYASLLTHARTHVYIRTYISMYLYISSDHRHSEWHKRSDEGKFYLPQNNAPYHFSFKTWLILEENAAVCCLFVNQSLRPPWLSD